MIPRNQMPQISAEHLGLFLRALEKDSVHITKTKMAARNLIPMQALNPSKVQAMKENPRSLDKPVVIARDNKIVDGHHRYGVGLETGKPLNIIKIGLSFDDIYTRMHEFEHAFTREFHEEKASEDDKEPDAESDETPEIKLSGKKNKIDMDVTDADLYVSVNEEAETNKVEVIPKDKLPVPKDSSDAERIFRQMYMRAKGERNEERRKAWLSLAKSYLSKAITLHFDETSPEKDDENTDEKKPDEKPKDKTESFRPSWKDYK